MVFRLPVAVRAVVLMAATGLLQLAGANTVITYPGWRGNNLISNGTLPQDNPASIGIDYNDNGTVSFPFGMQFMYPCGGMPLTTNRTKWPYKGGALSVAPGFGTGFKKSFMYVNIGVSGSDAAPANYSFNVVPAFEIAGPNNSDYAGQFCLPQVPMPVNGTLQPGDNITIQVVETTTWGAATYSCVDVTLAEPADVETVTPQNCYNSSDLTFELVFSTAALTSGAARAMADLPSSLVWTFALALSTGLYALL